MQGRFAVEFARTADFYCKPVNSISRGMPQPLPHTKGNAQSAPLQPRSGRSPAAVESRGPRRDWCCAGSPSRRTRARCPNVGTCLRNRTASGQPARIRLHRCKRRRNGTGCALEAPFQPVNGRMARSAEHATSRGSSGQKTGSMPSSQCDWIRQQRLWQRNLHRTSFFMAVWVLLRT
jgi:hypothetical protein